MCAINIVMFQHGRVATGMCDKMCFLGWAVCHLSNLSGLPISGLHATLSRWTQIFGLMVRGQSQGDVRVRRGGHFVPSLLFWCQVHYGHHPLRCHQETPRGQMPMLTFQIGVEVFSISEILISVIKEGAMQGINGRKSRASTASTVNTQTWPGQSLLPGQPSRCQP